MPILGLIANVVTQSNVEKRNSLFSAATIWSLFSKITFDRKNYCFKNVSENVDII